MPLFIRKPNADDGWGVYELIKSCPPLDVNSRYHALVQCDHFAETCIVAERGGQIIGWISGHVIPGKNPELFIWQVAVSSDARGLGLGKRMLKHILERPALSEVRYLHTTVTPDNEASWGMFKSLARDLDAPIGTTVMFESDAHFQGAHDDEVLLQIGPFEIED
jgi:L-2,4-diaminobutyric acid acetyltransferase